MSSKYLISVDQSTSGTKALLFDAKGVLLERADLPHEQLISEMAGSSIAQWKFTIIRFRL